MPRYPHDSLENECRRDDYFAAVMLACLIWCCYVVGKAVL